MDTRNVISPASIRTPVKSKNFDLSIEKSKIVWQHNNWRKRIINVTAYQILIEAWQVTGHMRHATRHAIPCLLFTREVVALTLRPRMPSEHDAIDKLEKNNSHRKDAKSFLMFNIFDFLIFCCGHSTLNRPVQKQKKSVSQQKEIRYSLLQLYVTSWFVPHSVVTGPHFRTLTCDFFVIFIWFAKQIFSDKLNGLCTIYYVFTILVK